MGGELKILSEIPALDPSRVSATAPGARFNRISAYLMLDFLTEFMKSWLALHSDSLLESPLKCKLISKWTASQLHFNRVQLQGWDFCWNVRCWVGRLLICQCWGASNKYVRTGGVGWLFASLRMISSEGMSEMQTGEGGTEYFVEVLIGRPLNKKPKALLQNPQIRGVLCIHEIYNRGHNSRKLHLYPGRLK